MGNRRKTSIVVDEDLWKQFLTFSVRKHGSARMVSVELEKAVKEYLAKYEGDQ